MQPKADPSGVPAAFVGAVIGAGIAFLYLQRKYKDYNPVEEAQKIARRALGIE